MLLSLWISFVKWFKTIFFTHPDQSDIFSKSFNVKKWLLFVTLVFLLFIAGFTLYKLFDVSSKYLQLQDKYNLQTKIYHSKEARYAKEIETIKDFYNLTNKNALVMDDDSAIGKKAYTLEKRDNILINRDDIIIRELSPLLLGLINIDKSNQITNNDTDKKIYVLLIDMNRLLQNKQKLKSMAKKEVNK